MRGHVRQLRQGQEVWALVEETIARNEAIINFSGELVRVSNKTEQNLRPGQRVLLVVEATTPLRLKLVNRPINQRRKNQNLDIIA